MNINYSQLLTEERTASSPLGCLMAKVAKSYADKILSFGKKIIRDDILFIQNNEFGREKEPHVTIKYGFDPDLTELEIRKTIKGVKPFQVTINKLSLFHASPSISPFHSNNQYDVVKLDVESPILRKLRELCDLFPNKDTFPKYHPHLTLAYVLKDSFTIPDKSLNMSVKIDQIYYSPAVGEKSYFNL